MKQIINGADLRRMIISAAAAIEINKQALNDLNVFPVPDGDTGTNMSMTINAAAGDLRKLEDPELGKAAKAAASAMLRGARGNSGVILSLLMRTRILFQTRTCGLQLSMSIMETSTIIVAATFSEDMATGAMLRRRSAD